MGFTQDAETPAAGPEGRTRPPTGRPHAHCISSGDSVLHLWKS